MANRIRAGGRGRPRRGDHRSFSARRRTVGNGRLPQERASISDRRSGDRADGAQGRAFRRRPACEISSRSRSWFRIRTASGKRNGANFTEMKASDGRKDRRARRRDRFGACCFGRFYGVSHRSWGRAIGGRRTSRCGTLCSSTWSDQESSNALRPPPQGGRNCVGALLA